MIELLKEYQEMLILGFTILGIVLIGFYELRVLIRRARKKRYRISKLPIVFALILFILVFGIRELTKTSVEKPNDKDENIVYSDDEMQIHFIDVGQGDSIFIDYGEFEILVDTSTYEYEDKVYEYISPLVDGDLDYFVATHMDSDHIGGAKNIFKQFNVSNVADSSKLSKKDTKTFKSYIESRDAEGAKLHQEDFTLEERDLKIDFIFPTTYHDENNISVVMIVDFQGVKTLLTGDMEKDQEADILDKLVDVDILKVGHHGSRTSSSPKFMEIIKPEYAVIQCGTNNKYGHPHKEILDLFNKENIKIYRTDLNGDIVLNIKEGKFEFDTLK